jgi:hypothetical protein
MFPLDSKTQNLVAAEHAESLRKAKARPARDGQLQRTDKRDDEASRPLLGRALRAARV